MSALAALALLATTGCSPSVPSDEPADTSPTRASSPATPTDTASPTVTPSSSDPASPSGTPQSPTPQSPTPVGSPLSPAPDTPGQTPSASAATPSPTGPPPVLDRAAANRDLTIADFFATPIEWNDGQFDVASERGLTGISGPLRTCAEDEASAQTFELRLANQFSRFSARFGQANNSESSDAEMLVRIIGNGTFIDSKRVKFNKLESIQVPVNGVNALKIEVFMTGKACDENLVVNAVLTGVRLE